MALLSTDQEWEHFGQSDPYWAVLTNEKYRGKTLPQQHFDAFFDSGETYVKNLWSKICHHLDPDFTPKRALDFGCGVGRLTIPLARRCNAVVGVDISESMLAEAKTNCDRLEVRNCQFVQSDDQLSRVTGKFDLINSSIVFQHIPSARGRKIFANMVDLLAPGGVGVVHLTYSRRQFTDKLERSWPEYSNLLRLVEQWSRWSGQRIKCLLRKLDPSRAWRSTKPAVEMQMNPYLLNPIFHTLQAVGVKDMFTQFRRDAREWGVVLYFRKPTSEE